MSSADGGTSAEVQALLERVTAARSAAAALSSPDGVDDARLTDGTGDRGKHEGLLPVPPPADSDDEGSDDSDDSAGRGDDSSSDDEKKGKKGKKGSDKGPRGDDSTGLPRPPAYLLKSQLLWNDNANGDVTKWLKAFDEQRAAERALRLALAKEKEKDAASSSSASKKDSKKADKDKDKPLVVLSDIYDAVEEDADGCERKRCDLPICVEALQEHLFREGRLAKEDLLKIVGLATEIFARESNLLEVAAPITVCGDVHGQFYDLVKLFEVGGTPNSVRYLFLGDYVDRGSFSVECVLLLFAMKICFPHTFFMIRGNHECRHLTSYFTFKGECEVKYDSEVYEAIMDSFDALPLAGLLNRQFLCVHGGISPDIDTLDEIREIDRFCEPPQAGPMCDLLWADPMEDGDFEAADSPPFLENDTRGCSYLYSHQAVCTFLDRNDLLSVIRAHEAQDHGYRMHARSASTGFPSVITLFSAPNYLDAYGNKGAVLRYDANVMNIRQFNHSPHPYWLPNFLNVFSWSLPFCAEKVNEILVSILELCDDDEEREKEERMTRIRSKVLAYARMVRVYQTLVSERDTLMKIKTFMPDEKLPPGLLMGGADAIQKALGDFQAAKQMDKGNEKRPESPVMVKKADSSAAAALAATAPFARKNPKLHRLASSEEFQTAALEQAREARRRMERRQSRDGATTPEAPRSPEVPRVVSESEE